MAVTAVNPLAGTGSWSLEKQQRDITRAFEVSCSSDWDDSIIAIQAVAALYGDVGSPYDSRDGGADGTDMPEAICTNIRANGAVQITLNGVRSGILWKVEQSFSTCFNYNPEQFSDPIAQDPIFKFNFQKISKPAPFDLDNKAFMSSSKSPFNPPPPVEETRVHITIQINRATMDMSRLMLLTDAINDRDWSPAGVSYTFPQFTCKVEGASATPLYQGGTYYYQHDYNICALTDGRVWWPLKILDRSFYHLDLVSGKKVVINDMFGKAMQTESLLDGSGQVNPIGAAPVYLNFRVNNFADFGGNIL